jgi:TRAP-type mannitol/chloroaromatic compound transport system substrate-binding protein
MTGRIITRRKALGGSALGVLAAPSVAVAQNRRWRCVTSWPKNLLGPGVSAARLVERINAMSRGELTIDLFPAGEIVPALQVLDAVSSGTVEMGHTAALFWQGKMPASPLFTTAPFGLTPASHSAWIDQDGGTLWDELYAPFKVRGILAGNTGPSTGGWFRNPIVSVDDLKGLRMRVTGLGGEVMQRLGVTPIVIAPGETYQALERGLLDAVEFLAPANDQALGLHKVAPHLAVPGFNKPNGASELLIGVDTWQNLPEHLRLIIKTACRAEHDEGLANADRANAAALRQVVAEGAKPMAFSDAILERAAKASLEVIGDISAKDPLSARIVASYQIALKASGTWVQFQGQQRIAGARARI